MILYWCQFQSDLFLFQPTNFFQLLLNNQSHLRFCSAVFHHIQEFDSISYIYVKSISKNVFKIILLMKVYPSFSAKKVTKNLFFFFQKSFKWRLQQYLFIFNQTNVKIKNITMIIHLNINWLYEISSKNNSDFKETSFVEDNNVIWLRYSCDDI